MTETVAMALTTSPLLRKSRLANIARPAAGYGEVHAGEARGEPLAVDERDALELEGALGRRW